MRSENLVVVEAVAGIERRDWPARLARDQLAELIDVPPKRLGFLDRELAVLLRQRLERAEHSAQAASHDELTGLLNRSPGQQALEAELGRAARSNTTFALIFGDVDGLKEINDSAGHEAGDRILRGLGSALEGALRPYDVGIRWGGDELVVVLPECDLEEARAIAARISERFEDLTGATVTCGCAELEPGDSAATLTRRADLDMYERKKSPRLY